MPYLDCTMSLTKKVDFDTRPICYTVLDFDQTNGTLDFGDLDFLIIFNALFI